MSTIEYTVHRGDDESGQTTKRPDLDLAKDEVLVKITHSALCYTDVHRDYKKSKTASLGQHEGVGVVERVGPGSKLLKKGDRVGYPYQHDTSTCGHCEMCLVGADTYSPEVVLYNFKDLDQGSPSLATHVVIREPFLVQIPSSIPSELAAPLMCGGITVFEAISRHGTKSTERVGVIGVGGLGHLAIQILAKMGCEVVVFSRTEGKREQAMEMGASEFYVTKGKNPGELDIGRKLNRLFVTANASFDWDLYLPILAPHCNIHAQAVNWGNLEISQMAVTLTTLYIHGSACGRRHTFVPMLDFCAHHGIKPIIQKFPMSVEGIEKAFDALEKGHLRYIAVLEA